MFVIPDEDEPAPPTREEYAAVQGEVGVCGSETVAKALAPYYDAAWDFVGTVGALRSAARGASPGDELPGSRQLRAKRDVAIDYLDDVVRAMRRDLEE